VLRIPEEKVGVGLGVGERVVGEEKDEECRGSWFSWHIWYKKHAERIAE